MMPMRRCPVFRCDNKRWATHFCCAACWKTVPPHLKTAIANELDNCKRAGIAHSDELLALRDQVVNHLSARNRKRLEERDAMPQLPLVISPGGTR